MTYAYLLYTQCITHKAILLLFNWFVCVFFAFVFFGQKNWQFKQILVGEFKIDSFGFLMRSVGMIWINW